MPVTTVPTYVPPDSATRLTALETSDAQQIFLSNAKQLLSGGGVLSVDTGYNVKWSNRFIMMGVGKSTTLCPDGYFDITMPPAGTVIPRMGGDGSSVTVTASGINFNGWDGLYYILPIGAPAATVNANFRLVQYTTPFTVPYNWIPIAMRNDDMGAASIQWCNGINMTPWFVPSFVNGWATYSAPYGSNGHWRKFNGRVEMKGLIMSGTVGVPAFTLPVGCRPDCALCITAESNDVAGQIRIFTDGTVNPWTPTPVGWVSLATCGFTPSG